jgi:hypothetical protein
VQEAFPPLDVDRIPDFPADFGAFSFESLCVSYDFTRDEYNAALSTRADAKELSEPLKTVVHETMHLLHATTTPFGLFVYRIRGLQTLLVADAIRAARSQGQAVTFPLQKTFRALPAAIAREVEWRMRVWYGIELLVLVMMGEIDVWSTHIVNNPYLRGVTIAELFAHVQYYLSQAASVRGPQPGSLESVARNEPEMEDVDGNDVGIEGAVLAFDMLAGGANTLAIIETAGTVSEYAGSSQLALEAFKAHIQGTRWVHSTVPKSWLTDALHYLPASTLPEFILSHLALCEVALFAPVLPEHRALRKGGVRSSEILPFVRWQHALHAAANIPPLKSLRDYDRYTRQVCEAARLTPPQAIVVATASGHEAPPLDPREQSYWKAQRIRAQAPGAFLDALGMLGRLPMDLDFPVIKYTDRTLFLKDKMRLHQLVMVYLTQAVTRRMLLRPDLVVTMPYPPTPEESTFYTTELRTVLEQALGMAVPGVIVAQPA